MNTLFSTIKHHFTSGVVRGTLVSLLCLSSASIGFSAPPDYDQVQPRPIYAFEFLTFRAYGGEKTMIEMFCQVPTNDFQFIRFKEGFLASYQLSVTLVDEQENEVGTATVLDSVMVQTFREIDLPRLPRMIRVAFLVDPGEYEARVNIRDFETLRDVGFKHVVEAPNYCLDLHNGRELWNFETKGRIRTSPIVWRNYVLGASEDRFLYAFAQLEGL